MATEPNLYGIEPPECPNPKCDSNKLVLRDYTEDCVACGEVWWSHEVPRLRTQLADVTRDREQFRRSLNAALERADELSRRRGMPETAGKA